MTISNRDVRRLLNQVEAAGGRWVRAKSGHYKVYLGRQFVTTVSQTPSDRRSLLNARAAIRRAGLEI